MSEVTESQILTVGVCSKVRVYGHTPSKEMGDKSQVLSIWCLSEGCFEGTNKEAGINLSSQMTQKVSSVMTQKCQFWDSGGL